MKSFLPWQPTPKFSPTWTTNGKSTYHSQSSNTEALNSTMNLTVPFFFFEFPFFVSNLRYYDIPPRRPDIPISWLLSTWDKKQPAKSDFTIIRIDSAPANRRTSGYSGNLLYQVCRIFLFLSSGKTSKEKRKIFLRMTSNHLLLYSFRKWKFQSSIAW